MFLHCHRHFDRNGIPSGVRNHNPDIFAPNFFFRNQLEGKAFFPLGSGTFERAVQERKTAMQDRVYGNQTAGPEERFLRNHVRVARSEGVKDPAAPERGSHNSPGSSDASCLCRSNLVQQFAGCCRSRAQETLSDFLSCFCCLPCQKRSKPRNVVTSAITELVRPPCKKMT